MRHLVLPVPCDCPDENIAVVVNAFNEAKARCLDCGEDGLISAVLAPPGDWLR